MAARTRRPYTESREYIKIEGNTVKLISEQVNRVIKLEDFITTTGGYSGISTPILPNGCKYFRQKQSHSVLVIEKPPQTKRLHWTGMNPDTTKINWKLAFPYTIFVLEFQENAITSQSRLYYKKTPIISLDDMLFHTNLCNVYSYDRICTGNMRSVGESMSEKADSFIAAFWQSNFNPDLIADQFNVDAIRIPQVSNLEAWQTASKDTPLFPLEINWRESSTLAAAINSFFGDQ